VAPGGGRLRGRSTALEHREDEHEAGREGTTGRQNLQSIPK
jgi:hypothetical protein